MKQADISPLLELLPTFEKQFPFPEQYKRKDMSNLPNAAPAHKIVGIGGLGPTFCTLAYCLPNYQDIRSELGSKQIMYPAPAPSDIPRYMQVVRSSFYFVFESCVQKGRKRAASHISPSLPSIGAQPLKIYSIMMKNIVLLLCSSAAKRRERSTRNIPQTSSSTIPSLPSPPPSTKPLATPLAAWQRV